MRYRTDLALEAKENLEESGIKPGEKDGIIVEKFSIDEDISVTAVDITNVKGEVLLGKPQGRYVTLEIKGIAEEKEGIKERSVRALAGELSKFVRHSYYLKALVIGLGNRKVTPDSLGPVTMDKVRITGHLFQIFNCDGDEEQSYVCGISPGVTASTGMETADIIRKLVAMTKPDVVIAIDSLAARSIERVSTTVQISNTGISPGAGMGNMRKELNKETLGTEVVSIGVPTVIDGKTVVMEAAEGMKIQEKQVSEYFAGNSLDMVVTTTDIDVIIESFSDIISKAINICLHPGIYS